MGCSLLALAGQRGIFPRFPELTMLDAEKVRAASRLLVGHWDSGTRLDAIPQELRPQTRIDGYAIQSHVMERSVAPLFGWKIAATSLAGQRHINVDGPMAGRLIAEKSVDIGGTVSRMPWRACIRRSKFRTHGMMISALSGQHSS
jgi:hypothetical protein